MHRGRPGAIHVTADFQKRKLLEFVTSIFKTKIIFRTQVAFGAKKDLRMAGVDSDDYADANAVYPIAVVSTEETKLDSTKYTHVTQPSPIDQCEDGEICWETPGGNASKILWNDNEFDSEHLGIWTISGKTGGFIVDLYALVPVIAIRLRQTANGHKQWNFGTKTFLIEVSSDMKTWVHALGPTSLNKHPGGKVQTWQCRTIDLVTRYVRFTATDCYDNGVGLSHFSIDIGPTELEDLLNAEIAAVPLKAATKAYRKASNTSGKKSEVVTALEMINTTTFPALKKLERIIRRASRSVRDARNKLRRYRDKLEFMPPLTGLINAGATCYLNDSLQALFMTPELRCGLFKWRYRCSYPLRTDGHIPYLPMAIPR